MGSAPSLPVRPQPVFFALRPGLAGIIAPQRADPEAEIDENQRHSGKSYRQLLMGVPDLLRDNVGCPGEERKERDRDRGLGYSQHVHGMPITSTAAERPG